MPEYVNLDKLGYPKYRVGDDGSVWSFRCRTGTKIKRWKQLKPWTIKGGYEIIGLRKGKKRICKMLHHLVLESFIGPRPDGQEGCHNNNDPSDNRLSNLRWDTPKNNCVDRAENGLHLKNTGRGSTHGCHKLIEEQILEIRSSDKYFEDLAFDYGVSVRTIRDIINRKTWRHI